MKLIALPLFFNAMLSASQLLVVITEDFNASTAVMSLYDDGKKIKSIPVNLGRNGLGWGIGKVTIAHQGNEPLKHEGDGKAPAGIFKLGPIYTQKYRSYKNLLCIDDIDSPYYNTIRRIKDAGALKSYEYMHRDDNLYDQVIVVEHNTQGIKGKGSCIFIHNQKGPGIPTAGCTSMPEESLKEIIAWIHPEEALLIQLPKRYCAEAKKRFDEITCPAD